MEGRELAVKAWSAMTLNRLIISQRELWKTEPMHMIDWSGMGRVYQKPELTVCQCKLIWPLWRESG